jgi:hypothetical protein
MTQGILTWLECLICFPKNILDSNVHIAWCTHTYIYIYTYIYMCVCVYTGPQNKSRHTLMKENYVVCIFGRTLETVKKCLLDVIFVFMNIQCPPQNVYNTAFSFVKVCTFFFADPV